MPFCITCGKGQSRLNKGGFCSNCLKVQQNNTLMESFIMAASQNVTNTTVITCACAKCGTLEHQLNDEQICSTCVSNELVQAHNRSINSDTAIPQYDVADTKRDERDVTNDATFWEKMDVLFDKKLSTFEAKVTEKLMQEVRKITDPVKTEIETVKTENKKLKAEITILKANQKTKDEKVEVLEKSVKEQQKFLARTDKDNRLKRLLLAGVPEKENIKIGNEVAASDRDKVDLIIKSCGIDNITVERVRRTGALDRGTDKRPRFILIEFNSWSERNRVKKEGEKMKDNPETKYYFFKADLSKEEKEEYARLYRLKENITKENPASAVEVKYGKLFVNSVPVDKVKSVHSDF